MKQHNYKIQMEWTGNLGNGTEDYGGYSRNHQISIAGKPALMGSSDPSFRGDPARYNPEELLVASLSSCHMLSYLHLCAINRVSVTAYRDEAHGVMQQRPDGSGGFESVTLHPEVTISPDSDENLALELHHKAHELCFIANSVKFRVTNISAIKRDKQDRQNRLS